MKLLKRYLGILWILLGPVIIIVLIKAAVFNISSGGTGDINKPIPWIIVIAIFTPVAIGLSIFGWYAWKGEFDIIEDHS
jgi:type VI protein secretion system component VasK